MTLRVAHVLNSRGRGGVPHVVNALIRRADPDRILPHVYYLKAGEGPDLMDDMDLPRGEGTGGKTGAMIGLVNWLEANRIDILHTHSFRPNIYGRMAGAVLRPRGLKVVAHYHNDYSDKWQNLEILGIERSLSASTDAAITVSEAVARHVAENVPGIEPMYIIENGIDPMRLKGNRAKTRSELGLNVEHIVIGLVGRVCQQKGIDTFVEAALALAPGDPRVRFLIIGDIEDHVLEARLTGEIAAAGQQAAVKFVGYRADAGAVFSALDILAAPSRWEGFGLVLAEAMFAGVPIVAARVGGISSVVGDAALLVPHDNAEALAANLRALSSDPQARANLVEAGRKRASKFDWDRAADRIDAIYHSIAAPS